MNIADILILAVVATAVALVCKSLFRRSREGCGCGCSGCTKECQMRQKE
ncbi:MAG: FeoB-associated Cys-rich membrane protein [Bacteroidaceae bacterium]|nr:FeoB-associated Cys-rich membrane protein [Bacteroidaceae bacterium]